MKNSLNGHILFLVFVFLFYTGMFCSKVIHPLWFSHNDSLPIFGFGYALMAFVGMFSFLYGAFTQKIGPSLSVKLGCLLYSLGLFLRVYPTSYSIVAISSVLSGVGASTVLICLRYWISSVKNDASRVRIISNKNIAVNLGCSVGAILAGIILSVGHKIGLIVAGVIPLIAIVIVSSKRIHFLYGENQTDRNSSITQCFEAFKRDRFLALGLFVFSGIAGLTSSFIMPYLPIIYSKMGVQENLIGYIMAFCTISSGFLQIRYREKIKNSNKKRVFFLFDIAFAVATFLLSLSTSLYLFMFVIVVRALIASVVLLLQEMIELELIGDSNAPVFFGVMQSSFLFGDMIGGSVAAYAYGSNNLDTMIFIATSLIVFNAFFLPIFSSWREGRTQKLAGTV